MNRFKLLTAALLAIGAAATWAGKPSREVSPAAIGQIWADFFRDADQFGLQVTGMTAKDEMALGRKLATNMLASHQTDPDWETYLNGIAQPLLQQRRRQEVQYQIHVLNEPVVNAFALPGGHIFVYTGLIDMTNNEDELIGVLGHEIAHIDLKHAVARHQYPRDIEFLRTLIVAAYDQQQELEADAYGLELMKRTGYDPIAMVDLMTRMLGTEGQAQVARTPTGELANIAFGTLSDYFRSHPPTRQRLRELQARVR